MKLKISELDALVPLGVVNINTKGIGVEDNIQIDSVPVQLSISPIRYDYRVIGNLSFPVLKSCDRCLTEYKDKVNANFEIMVISNDSPLSESDDADLIVLNPGQIEVDLGPSIRDAIAIENNLKNLCKNNCKGICLKCGVNLNNQDCLCLESQTDDRWEALKKNKLLITEN